MAKTTTRTSFSLPTEQVRDLTRVAEFLGVTRTSLVASMLEKTLGPVVLLVDEFERAGIDPQDLDSGALNEALTRKAYDALDRLDAISGGFRDELDSLQ